MAVYTQVNDEELAHFLQHYDAGRALAFKGIAEGVENTNYFLKTDAGSYILTLYEKRVQREDLPFFLSLLEHLAAHGIACPLPVRSKDGHAWRELHNRAAALMTFLPGISVRRPDAHHCAEAGTALARLHLAGGGFGMTRPNALSLEGWRQLVKQCEAKANDVRMGLAAVIVSELRFLEQHWPRNLPSGIIHADFFPDNVFFRDGRISGLIDFYFACNDAFAYDLAIALNAWCFEGDGAFNVTKGRALLQAYHHLRNLSPEEVSTLPVLARGAALRFLLTRLHDWLHRDERALVTAKDPNEYALKLRFHQAAIDAQAYGWAT